MNASRKSIAIILLLVLLMRAFTVQAASNDSWHAWKFTSDFDGRTIWNAASPRTTPSTNLSFPYADLTSHIVIGKDKGDVFALFKFNKLNIQGGRYGVYEGAVQYKLDAIIGGEKKTVTVYQVTGSDDLRIVYPNWFVQQVRNNESIKIRFRFFGQGPVVLEYDTSNADKALDKFLN